MTAISTAYTTPTEAKQAYAAHFQATKELHQAQIQVMRPKRTIRTLNDELSHATAAAAEATELSELADRKRKAESAATQDFELASQMTRDVTELRPSAAERSPRRRSTTPPPP
jgi:hypothetical protein